MLMTHKDRMDLAHETARRQGWEPIGAFRIPVEPMIANPDVVMLMYRYRGHDLGGEWRVARHFGGNEFGNGYYTANRADAFKNWQAEVEYESGRWFDNEIDLCVRRVETLLRECDTCHRAYGYDGTHESSQAPGLSCCERCYGQEVVRDA